MDVVEIEAYLFIRQEIIRQLIFEAHQQQSSSGSISDWCCSQSFWSVFTDSKSMLSDPGSAPRVQRVQLPDFSQLKPHHTRPSHLKGLFYCWMHQIHRNTTATFWSWAPWCLAQSWTPQSSWTIQVCLDPSPASWHPSSATFSARHLELRAWSPLKLYCDEDLHWPCQVCKWVCPNCLPAEE